MPNKNVLSQDFIEGQRKRLEALKLELLGDGEAAANEAGETQEEHGNEAKEYEDSAQELDRKEVLQAKYDVDTRRLGNIERALKKIELGSYGLSDVSGKPIPKDRLEAIPEAVLTVTEATAKE